MPAHKRGALRVLAAAAADAPFPEDVAQDLHVAARAAAEQPVPPWTGLLGENGSAAGPAVELLTALGDGDGPDADRLPALLGGDTAGRVSAARLAGRRRSPADIGVLLVLATDREPAVRAAAARGLVRALALAAEDQRPVVLAGLVRCSADPGSRVPRALAAELRGPDQAPAQAVADVLQVLRGHPSASVQGMVEGLSDAPNASGPATPEP